MKHFTITTETEAAALRPFRMSQAETPQIGDIVSPMAGCAVVTHWQDYPEDEALTFEECMAVVRDEVTEVVLREVGTVTVWDNRWGRQVTCDIVNSVTDAMIEVDEECDVELTLSYLGGGASIEIPNPTATKIKLLAAILRGEDI